MDTTQKPPRKDRTNPRGHVPPVPTKAKITMDFKNKGATTAAVSGAGTNTPLSRISEPSQMVRRQRLNPKNIPTENEAEMLEYERQNRKFLPYANVHILISETLNRNKGEWLHNHKKTRVAVADAIRVLAEQKKRDISDDYTRAKYGLVKGFGDLIQNKKTLYDFEMWLIKKESQYERLSGAYSEIRVLSFAPYEQVVDRCREMIKTSEVARDYYIMVGHTSKMNGPSAEDAIEMEDGLTGKPYSTVGELEKLRFDVWLQTRIPMQEEGLLREKEAALMRVGELLKTINEEGAAHEARVGRIYTMLERADRETDELEAIDEKRFKLMTQQADALKTVQEEMADVREKNQELVERVTEMENNIARLTAKRDGRDSEELTDDDARRETVPSAAFPVPVELIAAAEAVKREDVTEEIPIEEVEEIRGERSRFWKTVPGRIISNVFIYGVAGKEKEKRYPPKKEDYESELEHSKAGSDYYSWYGQTGRKIRKTLEGTKRNWKAVTAVATGVAVLAAATTGYFMYAPAQERPGQRALSELNQPAATQVAVVDETAPTAEEIKKVEPKPEPLAKLVLADVLAKHNLELEKGTNMANFYKSMGGIENVQEKYVIFEEALRTDEQLQKYERKYSEKPILEMYADFLKTAMAYAQLAGQTDIEKANAKAIGERVAKRVEKLTLQKRIKKKLGKDRASEMRELAGQFTEFAAALPAVAEVEDEKPEETLVITSEQFEGMKKAGEEPEIAVIILPDRTDEKPFDMEKEMGKVVKAEFESLDSPSKVNEFNGKVNKAKDLETKFLLSAHLTDQLVEHGMGAKMSEKRVLSMHINTMNTAILFAMADGQGMTAIAEALNAFDLANGEVKRFLGYKKMQKDLEKKKGAIDKNVKWLRNRAEELKNKVDAYERNKDTAIPLPGSPTVDNGNGSPTTMPETVQLDKGNQFVAMQTVVFTKYGLSILEHPLEVHKKMKGMKINNFDKFIILENLAEKIKGNPRWMDGLSKAEQFDMLRMLGAYLRATKKAANEPKNWAEGYTRDDIMLNSLAIDVSELLKELRKLGKGNVGESQRHLQFPLDTETFNELGKAMKEFDELLTYEYRQKRRMNGNNGE